MRDYIFHGKRIDTDEWVEGYLGYNKTRKQYYIMDDVDSFPIPVHKESVGEWTGLVDKSGRRIFEGDIVRCQERFDRPYSDKRKSKRHIGVVEYNVRGGNKFYNRTTKEWDRHIDYAAEWIVKVEDYGKFVHGAWGDFFDCEVIGTVFENSDLLEV